jgi:hypothetical protein
MKALTLWQPWASLIACGAKKYETRSWPAPKTLKPGDPVAIHAAARQVHINELSDELMELMCAGSKLGPASTLCMAALLPRSAVLAVCEFVECRGTNMVHDITAAEQAMGDWDMGRWAWRLQVVYVAEPPIPAAGHQGLWEWDAPDYVEEAVNEMLQVPLKEEML